MQDSGLVPLEIDTGQRFSQQISWIVDSIDIAQIDVTGIYELTNFEICARYDECARRTWYL